MNTISKANQLFKNGKYKDAIVLYSQAAVQYPTIAESLKLNIAIAKRRSRTADSSSVDFEVHAVPSQVVKESIESESIFIGIAAIPEREYALREVIASLLPQADRIGVYLNGWSSIPEYLKDPKIQIEGFGGRDLGDAGKFYWVDNHEGIYFTCDDDLVYPEDYVRRTVSKLRHYERKAVVGWHGSLLKAPFVDYYDTASRRVFTFGAHRPHDTPVHILGTGCSAFYTKNFPVKLADFLAPNMADIFFALKGQELRIPFYVMAHEKGEIREVEGAKASSIYADSHNKVESKKNTLELQNRHVKSHPSWVTHDLSALSILIIGRFESYSKGGIYKSCHLIQTQLQALGHEVITLDTQNELEVSSLSRFDLCWIYPGDPERPDFSTVDHKIAQLQDAGVPVLVNLSYLNDGTRPTFIRNKLLSYNRSGKTPVLAAVFTESAAYDPAFDNVRDYITVVPKTLLPTVTHLQPSFAEREGICLGDATKLANEKVIGGKIHPWIDAIHRRLPHVNLYAYKQYSGETPHPKIQYVSHMTDDFGDWLANRRLFICANINLTFEMVACEAQQYGTPVIYRHMPHSLSEYISATGFAVRNPDEMGEMVAWLYNDQASWNRISESSRLNASSNHVDLLSSSLVGYLRLSLFRAKKLQATPTNILVHV